jgi:hypothetical protein
MNYQYVARSLIILTLAVSAFGTSNRAYALEMPLAVNQTQAEPATAPIRRNITICELLRFNFDVKAKLYNQVSEPVARESYRADIRDIERLMNEAACK